MNKRVLCLLLAGILALGSGLDVLAASIDSVQQEQSETKNKLNEVNKSITAIENKRKEVQTQISSLNAELVDIMLTLEVIEADLERKQREIAEAQAEYDRLMELEEEQYQAMKLRIQYMYEKGNDDYVDMLLGAKNISDLVNRADFVQEVSDYDDEKLTEYQDTKDMVAETKAVLEEEQAELEEVQEAQRAYKIELDAKIASAKSKVKNFETELANAQAKVKEYQETIKQQTALIAQLEEEERKAAEAAEEDQSEDSDKKNGSNGSGSSGSSGSSGGSSTTSASGSGLGVQIANYALQFVGNPYVYGGTSLTNGADCSGFTWAVHKHFGITIPRRSTDQSYGGKSISLSAIQAGDIIYYGDHVGIYLGNRKIVHASTEKTGIKISSYTYRTPLRASRYW